MVLFAFVLLRVANAYPQPVHRPSTVETKDPKSLATDSQENLNSTDIAPRDAGNFYQCYNGDTLLSSVCSVNGQIQALCRDSVPGLGYYYMRYTDCPPKTICMPNMNASPRAARCVKTTAIIVWFIERGKNGETCLNIPTDSSGTLDQLVTTEIDGLSRRAPQVPDQISFGYDQNDPFQYLVAGDTFDGNWVSEPFKRSGNIAECANYSTINVSGVQLASTLRSSAYL
jgi:hypothetical protein